MKKWLFIILGIFGLQFSCNREDDVCWQGFDPGGTDIPGLLYCDKTKAELEQQFPMYWFHREDEPRFCWSASTPNGVLYLRQVPASMVDMYRTWRGIIYTKVDCNSFCVWEWIEKVQHKPSGLYGKSRTDTEIYMADSCSKLFQGRIIVTRETADSIYLREFVKKSE